MKFIFEAKLDLEAPSSASRCTESNNQMNIDLLHKSTKCKLNLVNKTKTLTWKPTTQVCPFEYLKVVNVLQLFM